LLFLPNPRFLTPRAPLTHPTLFPLLLSSLSQYQSVLFGSYGHSPSNSDNNQSKSPTFSSLVHSTFFLAPTIIPFCCNGGQEPDLKMVF